MFLNIQPLNPKTCNASLMLLIVNDKYLKIKIKSKGYFSEGIRL